MLKTFWEIWVIGILLSTYYEPDIKLDTEYLYLPSVYWVYPPTECVLGIPTYRVCDKYTHLPSVYLQMKNPQFWN